MLDARPDIDPCLAGSRHVARVAAFARRFWLAYCIMLICVLYVGREQSGRKKGRKEGGKEMKCLGALRNILDTAVRAQLWMPMEDYFPRTRSTVTCHQPRLGVLEILRCLLYGT